MPFVLSSGICLPTSQSVAVECPKLAVFAVLKIVRWSQRLCINTLLGRMRAGRSLRAQWPACYFLAFYASFSISWILRVGVRVVVQHLVRRRPQMTRLKLLGSTVTVAPCVPPCHWPARPVVQQGGTCQHILGRSSTALQIPYITTSRQQCGSRLSDFVQVPATPSPTLCCTLAPTNHELDHRCFARRGQLSSRYHRLLVSFGHNGAYLVFRYISLLSDPLTC
jgi:hypothetical protein